MLQPLCHPVAVSCYTSPVTSSESYGAQRVTLPSNRLPVCSNSASPASSPRSLNCPASRTTASHTFPRIHQCGYRIPSLPNLSLDRLNWYCPLCGFVFFFLPFSLSHSCSWSVAAVLVCCRDNDIHPNPHGHWIGGHQKEKTVVCLHAERQTGSRGRSGRS